MSNRSGTADILEIWRIYMRSEHEMADRYDMATLLMEYARREDCDMHELDEVAKWER